MVLLEEDFWLIVNRLYLPNAYFFMPAPRTCRAITNVIVAKNEASKVLVHSNIVYHEYRMLETAEDDQRILCGHVEHELVRHGDSFLIQAKRVDLIQSEAALSALSAPI